MKFRHVKIAMDIIIHFEDLLEKHNINIPDSERTNDPNENEARIFGKTYYELEEKIIQTLEKNY